MGLAPDIIETLSRARGDLRMGVPVVLIDPGGDALVLAAETVGPERLAAARALGAPVLAITGRRAETLRARAYDGDVARIRVPSDADAAWIASVADPAGDLSAPMKGPLASDRGGSAALHRAAIALVKAARLLPAALVVPVPDGVALAAAEGLTWVAARNAAPDAVAPLRRVVAATVPLESSETSRLHIFKPKDGAEEHYGM